MLSINRSNSEDELIRGCQKKKPAAQRALYERVAPKMLGVCYRYINDRDEAEHVMIGGMIRVFEKMDQYSGDGSFEGWIRRIMVNESLMYLRRNRSMSLEVDIENADYKPNLEKLDTHLETEDLIKLIHDLPIGYRTVFNMYAIEGYNHQEIASMLGISENTSKSQLCRARRFLQNKLVEIEQYASRKTIGNGTK